MAHPESRVRRVIRLLGIQFDDELLVDVVGEFRAVRAGS